MRLLLVLIPTAPADSVGEPYRVKLQRFVILNVLSYIKLRASIYRIIRLEYWGVITDSLESMRSSRIINELHQASP